MVASWSRSSTGVHCLIYVTVRQICRATKFIKSCSMRCDGHFLYCNKHAFQRHDSFTVLLSLKLRPRGISHLIFRLYHVGARRPRGPANARRQWLSKSAEVFLIHVGENHAAVTDYGCSLNYAAPGTTWRLKISNPLGFL